MSLCLGVQSCVVYRPLSGLHRPIAIDVQVENFKQLSLLIQCIPGKVLNNRGAQDLCRKLKRLFENQGAKVTTSIRLSRGEEEDPDAENLSKHAEEGQGREKAKDTPASPPQLTLRLTSRLIHRDVTNLLFFELTNWYSIAQEVTLTDDSGFVLIRERLTARFERQLGGRRIGNNFSQDFYGQLSQLTLNAKMRRQVLRESASSGSR